MSRISAIDVRLFHIPLAEVLVDAKHGAHHHFELVTATVRLANGNEGTGYTYTGGKGGHAIVAMIEHDLAPFLTGQDAEPVDELYEAMQWHVHYVARGGITLCVPSVFSRNDGLIVGAVQLQQIAHHQPFIGKQVLGCIDGKTVPDVFGDGLLRIGLDVPQVRPCD